MTALWIFLAVCPLAMILLLVFASHIDPLSGRWRGARLIGDAVKNQASASRKSTTAYSESPSTGS
jgi:hypothetical protein